MKVVWDVCLTPNSAAQPLLMGSAHAMTSSPVDVSQHLSDSWGAWLVASVVLLAVLGGLGVAVSRMQDPQRLRGLSVWWRARWRLYPGPGFARRLELWRHYGRPAAQRVAGRARPSLGPRWRRALLHNKEFAVFMGWAQGWVLRFRVYATLEDSVLVIAPHKEFKSAWLAGRIIDAPGPVVATSIRTDLIEATAGLRSRRGLVDVLNPEKVGNIASTVRPSLVRGCEDQQTALRRAGRLVYGSQMRGLSDEAFWASQAAMVLGAMLHAAALADVELATVYGWIVSDDPTPVTVLKIRRPGLNTELPAAIISRYLAQHPRTRDSIAMTLRQALRFMEDPTISSLLNPDPGEATLNFERFLRQRGTLYLVSGDDASLTAPLFACLLGEIHFYAHQLGSRQPYGRLDPPATFALDEVSATARIKELPGWLSTAAGSGMNFILAAQAFSQLKQQWGDDGARTIWNSAKAKMYFGATSDPEDLERLSQLCGEVTLRRREEAVDEHGRRTWNRRWVTVRVLAPEQVRMLPTGHALVIRRNVRPTIVRTERVWKRADVKRWKKAGASLPMPSLQPDKAVSFGLQAASPGDDLRERRRRRRAGGATRQPRPWDSDEGPA